MKGDGNNRDQIMGRAVIPEYPVGHGSLMLSICLKDLLPVRAL